MDLLSKNKALSAGIILLVLLNIATLGTLWWKSERQRPPEPPGRVGPGEFMAKQLGLTGDQVKQFEDRRRSYQREYETLVSHLKAARRDLYENLRSGDTSSILIVPKSEEIGRLQAQIELLRIHHFQSLRALCDDRQREVFDALMHDVFDSGPGQPFRAPEGPPGTPPGGPIDGPPGPQDEGPPPGPPPGGPSHPGGTPR